MKQLHKLFKNWIYSRKIANNDTPFYLFYKKDKSTYLAHAFIISMVISSPSTPPLFLEKSKNKLQEIYVDVLEKNGKINLISAHTSTCVKLVLMQYYYMYIYIFDNHVIPTTTTTCLLHQNKCE